jgi:lysine/ornithine N-monooxygenase
MLTHEEIKKLSRKEFADLLQQISTDFADEIYFKHDVDFVFDHYDSDLKVVYVRESENTRNPVTYGMLSELLVELKKLNSRMQIGIFYEDAPKGAS